MTVTVKEAIEKLGFDWWEELAAARLGQMKPLVASLKAHKAIKQRDWNDVSSVIAQCLEGKFKRPGRPPEWKTKPQEGLRYYKLLRQQDMPAKEALENAARMAGVTQQKIRNLLNRPKVRHRPRKK